MSWAACRSALWCFLIILAGSSGLYAGKASAEGPVQLAVVGTDAEGDDVAGKYVELWQNGTFVASGFMPATFAVSNATEYQVGAADFKNFLFDHWQDTGSTDRWRTVALSGDTELVAVYRIVADASSTGSTGGGSSGGSGGRSKAVIILAPEGGRTVKPAGIDLSGVTIGNPTSVEVAARNPTTGIGTPYRVAVPGSPGDFTWWSFSLAVNDLTMTQMQVRALFADGSQRTDAVEVRYAGGASKSVGVGDSVRLADAYANAASYSVSIDTVVAAADAVDPVPVDAGNAVEESPQTPFAWATPLMTGLAFAALLAGLAARKRQMLGRRLG
jgi:hypothetical protein